jgi:hypothetical protein
MPIRPRKEIQKRGAGGIPEAAYEYFAHGPFFDGEEWAKEKSEMAIEDFWKNHRDFIMERYLEENRKRAWVGRRPDFFWRDLTEPRLKTGTREYYKPYPDTKKYIADVFETDFEFLKRLNLLEPWEI